MLTNQHPEWALAHKKPGTELRLIRGRYYLYEYRTVYDKEKKGPRKISGKLLGSITQEEGFVASGKRKLEVEAVQALQAKPVCLEYGVSHMVANVLKPYVEQLKISFPHHWKILLAIAYCRFVYRCPLKNMPFRLSQSFLPDLISLRHFNDKTASQVLHEVGGMHSQQLAYMKSFLSKGEYLLMDATHVFSNSERITLSHKGYNSQMNFDPQFNLLYLYSSKTHMPVYYRILPGNIREVRAFKNCLLEVGLKKAVIVADKGFYSKKNVDLLREERLRFVLPLKRDNSLIDYSLITNNTFKEEDQFFNHEGRIIWYQEYTWDRMSLFIYLDESLRLSEERDYLTRIATHPESYTLEEYHRKKDSFGTLVLLTNLKDQTGEEVYQTYKSRMSIEVMFDGMKNVLDADHTYMQDEQTLHGWMFANHITLQWYQHLYMDLKTNGFLNKYSVNDYIQLMTDLKKIRINNAWHPNEVTSQTLKMVRKLGIPLEEYNT
ncbi:MAG: transposase [Paludibacter sp.]|nr:transposase [Paludibacter sp.]